MNRALPLSFFLLSALLLPARDARADACAPPQSAVVEMTPPTSCFAVTASPACNGGLELSFTNSCDADITGVSHTSSVQNIPAGYPPFKHCFQPWQDAHDAMMTPPTCLLAKGETDIGYAQIGDTLSFQYNSAPITIVLKAPAPTGGGGGEGGASGASGASAGGNSSASAGSAGDAGSNAGGDDDDGGCTLTRGASSRTSAGALLAVAALCALTRGRRRQR